MKIVAIVGSPRQKGNTSYLVDRALEEAEKMGIETRKIELGRYDIRPCLGHDDCSLFGSCTQKDDMGWILEEFLNADGVILATPVYWYNVTAQMKTFIDRNYFAYRHDWKYRAGVAGLIVVAEMEAIENTVHTLEQFVDWCFDIKEGGKYIAAGYAHKIGDVQANAELINEAAELGRKMAASLLEDA